MQFIYWTVAGIEDLTIQQLDQSWNGLKKPLYLAAKSQRFL